jgi:uncharacterized protein YcbK (DUF882 family)
MGTVKIYKRGEDIQLSTHFHLSEFICKCGKCDDHPIDMALIDLLEAIRAELPSIGGSVLKINSGYRCPSYNARIGGAKNSQHMLGKAADMRAPGASIKDLAKLVNRLNPKGGVGKYRSFVHADTRNGRARWGIPI